MIWNFDPVLFSLFGYEVRWYGLCFAMAFVVGRKIMRYFFVRHKQDPAQVDTLLLYVFISVLVGARIGHVLFYDPAYYFAHPIEILYLRQGGLASHGSAIGILIGIWLYARKSKYPYLWLLDRVVIAIALAGAFIRIGNFMNSEIYGKKTQGALGVIFAHTTNEYIDRSLQPEGVRFDAIVGSDSVRLTLIYKGNLSIDRAKQYTLPILRQLLATSQVAEHFALAQTPHTHAYHIRNYTHLELHLKAHARHPTQLYEALFALALFVLLFFLKKPYRPQEPNGRIFALFLILLWSFRFMIEFLKVPQEHFTPLAGLNMGQWLSIPFAVAGIGLWIWIRFSAHIQKT